MRGLFPAYLLVLPALAACNPVAAPPMATGNPLQPTAAPDMPATATIAVLVDVPVDIASVAGRVGTFSYAGQSVTIPGGDTFDHLRFHWYLYGAAAGEPTAFGALYLLDREYTGLPGDLSPSTPGFIAQSNREATSGFPADQGAEYVFDDAVTLTGGQRYWFYTDAQGALATSFDTDAYPGGDFYVTGYHAQPFRLSPASGRIVDGVFVPGPAGVFTDANFRLRAARR